MSRDCKVVTHGLKRVPGTQHKGGGGEIYLAYIFGFWCCVSSEICPKYCVNNSHLDLFVLCLCNTAFVIFFNCYFLVFIEALMCSSRFDHLVCLVAVR